MTTTGVAIAAAISPYRQARDEQRQLVEANGALFCEVYLECPLGVLIARDIKGLYTRLRLITVRPLKRQKCSE